VGTVGKTWLGDTNAGQPVYRAWAEFTVYWNHAKTLWVCDRYNGDGIGLAIEVDPNWWRTARYADLLRRERGGGGLP
jgi:hypothetical protein